MIDLGVDLETHLTAMASTGVRGHECRLMLRIGREQWRFAVVSRATEGSELHALVTRHDPPTCAFDNHA
jgi:hypothetical protein